jgi:SNF2 family DNA or RNA helicase
VLVRVEQYILRHRALIFCQMKQMLDIIENDPFEQYMPSVMYMQLDGRTDVILLFKHSARILDLTISH